jgi:hypothetical protein
MTWSPETYAEKFKQQKVLLDRLLAALGFLGGYTLYVAYRGRRDALSEALALMGSAEPQLATDPNLPLAPRVREHLEYERTAFLAAFLGLRVPLLLNHLPPHGSRLL